MKLVIETLTPLHIGSGETIEPYEYVITDKLYRINLGKFISSLSPFDRDEFLKVSSSDMIKTRQFIKEKADLSNVSEYSMNIDPEVLEIYENKKNDPNNLLSIQTFIKTSGKAYIPGSSIKGAIRTAMLFSKSPKPLADTWDIEKSVFKYNNPQNDPFRILKISDSPQLSSDEMCVYNVRTFTKKEKFSSSGYNMIIEATNSDYTDKSMVASHDIKFDKELKMQGEFQISAENLVSSCNEFYESVISKELKFYESSSISFAYERYEQLAKTLSEVKKEGSFILRLGWGSGFDSVTINLARSKPENKISRRLIHGEIPLGWVKAKILD